MNLQSIWRIRGESLKVAAIQFREVGKKYYFSLNGLDLEEKQFVVVETIKGIEIGRVHQLKEVDDSEIMNTLKPVLRIATEEDLCTSEKNNSDEEIIVQEVKEIVRTINLDIKILAAEYTLDRKKLTIHFESEQRVDFRELVKILNENYRTKIELRQISSREGAKLIGGIGPCGLILCCQTFIGEFDAVSIKMAKNQNIALNPQKISGACGKLLCCIKYEDDVYTELKQNLPDLGERVTTELGGAQVMQVNILGQKVKVRFDDEEQPAAWLALEEVRRKNA